MKKILKKKHAVKALVLGIGIAGMYMVPTLAMGAAAGPCVNCHTMHNSQDGGNVIGTDTPNGALVTGGCVGCHTSTNNTDNVQNNIPMVMHTGVPAATEGGGTLAGGSFYWVDDGGGDTDSMGHNVVGIAAADALGQVPPGWNVSFDANTTLGATWASNQLTCAGTYGCHGTHGPAVDIDDFTAVSGAHHGDDSTIDGSTVAKSYRFLLGIKGIEDTDWEDTVSASDHNQYYAAHRTADTEASTDSASINYLCAECHGDFHSGAGDLGIDADGSFGAAWLRHPTDIDMSDATGFVTGTEYAAYTTYDPLAPVGSSNGALVNTTVNAADNGIVLCLSCHRAHGSEYADLLRWDYADCDAASGNTAAQCGCFVCHTTKN